MTNVHKQSFLTDFSFLLQKLKSKKYMEGNVGISNHCQRIKSIDQIDMMDLSEVEMFKKYVLNSASILSFCQNL